MSDIHDALLKIQQELKAPKNQTNTFGKYKYRSLEDILEAVKPILKELKATLILSDKPIAVGDRVYIEATATLHAGDGGVSNTASAREALDRKGMDDSQITGTASSYARKYCVSGLFAIDDTKDADTMAPPELVTDGQVKELVRLIGEAGVEQEKFLAHIKCANLSTLGAGSFDKVKTLLTQRIAENNADN